MAGVRQFDRKKRTTKDDDEHEDCDVTLIPERDIADTSSGSGHGAWPSRYGLSTLQTDGVAIKKERLLEFHS
jgi:hypothetical protein